jgi:pre-mRNA-processing factor 17
MRLWDVDIPVAIKIIAEPSMHSMPAIGVHPSSVFLWLLVLYCWLM